MKRMEIHLTEKEIQVLEVVAKQDGRTRKSYCENEIRKILSKQPITKKAKKA